MRSTVMALILLMTMLLPLIGYAKETRPGTAEKTLDPDSMAQALNGALESHSAELDDEKAKLQQLDTLREAIVTEISVLDAQNTAHGQLMLMSSLSIEDLEKAVKQNRLASRALTQRVKTFQARYDAAVGLFQQTIDRIEMAEKQIADIRMSELPKERKPAIATATNDLVQVLKEKKRVREQYLKTCERMLGQLNTALDEKNAVGAQLTGLFQSRQQTSLLTRSDRYRDLNSTDIAQAFQVLTARLTALSHPQTWQSQWNQAKLGGIARWTVFFIALVFILSFQGRCRTMLQQVEARCDAPGFFYRRLGIMLIRHSLPLLGMTLLFGIYSSFEVPLLDSGLGQFLFMFFLLMLLTRWGLDGLEHGIVDAKSAVQDYAKRYLKRFFRFFRIIGTLMLLLVWVAGSGSLLTWVARDFMAATVLTWAIVFWRGINRFLDGKADDANATGISGYIGICKWWVYLVCGGTLLLNLAGYGQLARHWSVAWIGSVAILYWGWISRHAIREWQADHRVIVSAVGSGHLLISRDDVRWTSIQLSRLVWAIGLGASIVWVWDSSGILFSKLSLFFNFTVIIGSLTLSVKGVLLSALAIFLTHLSVQLGRSLLNEKILEKQSLERGLKDSILTISSYLAWGVGLLLALGVLGVNATSLAVVFGALSIGIGFGLQNIFNNFISGLILLFERPIQVGDVVEVNGLWAEVMKINVRSTVVKTFDNAAVIIPNSEFISQQVTNWSFKDPRMRRSIEIGVAYGSNVELVTETLMDIVAKMPKVSRKPKPDVLFTDHADSALIFRLRFWVHLDEYWEVPSKIRYEIDRRFRELGIEIAFPQRDLHIRTLPDPNASHAPMDKLDDVLPMDNADAKTT